MQRASVEQKVSRLFRKGDEIYKGYVDDPRNTDNAWMETVLWAGEWGVWGDHECEEVLNSSDLIKQIVC